MDDAKERAIKEKIKTVCSAIISKLQEPSFKKGNSDELVDIFQSTISLASLQRFSKSVEPQLEDLLYTLNKCDDTLKRYREAFFLTVRFKRYQFEKICYALNAQTDYLKNLLQVIKTSENSKDFSKEIREDTGKIFWANFAQDKLIVEWTVFANQLRGRFPKEFSLPKLEEQLTICLDPSRTGYVSAYKFSEFLKQFGPFNSCLTKMNHILSQSYFCGYLSSREANHLLYNKPPGTFLVRFSLSAPGAFAIELVKVSIMEPEHNLIKSNDQESSYDVLTKYMGGSQFRKGADCSFVHQMWYFGDISRQEADESLAGTKKGTFLIYNHSTNQGQYIAAYVSHSGPVLHVDITPQANGGFKIALPSHDVVYPGLQEMVNSLGVIFIKSADVASFRGSVKPEQETEYTNVHNIRNVPPKVDLAQKPLHQQQRPQSVRSDTVFQPMPIPLTTSMAQKPSTAPVKESIYGAMPAPPTAESHYADMPSLRAQANGKPADPRGSVSNRSAPPRGTVDMQSMYSPMGPPSSPTSTPNNSHQNHSANHYDSIPSEKQHDEYLRKKQQQQQPTTPKKEDHNYAPYPSDYSGRNELTTEVFHEYSDLPALQAEVEAERNSLTRTSPPEGMEGYDQIPVYRASDKFIVTRLDNKTILVAGNSTANSKGIAEIVLPINVGPSAVVSYSISFIGAHSKAFVERELFENNFTISSAPEQRLSWQVYISE